MRLGTKELLRLSAAAGGKHLISKIGEHHLPQACQSLFIVDEKNALVSPGDRLWARAKMLFLRDDPRYDDLEERPLVRMTPNGNRPSMKRDNPMNYGKSKTGPFPHSFGGEKWVEDSFQDGRIHAMPGIHHSELYVGSFV